MTPEERIAETTLSLYDRDRLREWPSWRLRDALSILHGARMAFKACGRYGLAPIDTACSLIEDEIDARARIYESDKLTWNP